MLRYWCRWIFQNALKRPVLWAFKSLVPLSETRSVKPGKYISLRTVESAAQVVHQYAVQLSVIDRICCLNIGDHTLCQKSLKGECTFLSICQRAATLDENQSNLADLLTKIDAAEYTYIALYLCHTKRAVRDGAVRRL